MNTRLNFDYFSIKFSKFSDILILLNLGECGIHSYQINNIQSTSTPSLKYKPIRCTELTYFPPSSHSLGLNFQVCVINFWQFRHCFMISKYLNTDWHDASEGRSNVTQLYFLLIPNCEKLICLLKKFRQISKSHFLI